MKYGLSPKQLQDIKTILAAWPDIDSAWLFGSRALGSYKEASDIDLAIMGQLAPKTLMRLTDAFEESDLPFFVDLVAYAGISEPALKKHIDEHGVCVYGGGDGSAVPGLNRDTAYQQRLLLPPLTEQIAIAAVLTSLDNKIDLLHRQNKTLEAMAETLFRGWFGDDASADWPQGTVEDLFVLQRGYDLPTQDRIAGPYPIVASSGLSGGHFEYKVKAPGVVTGRSGLLGKVFLVQEDFWPLNTSLYIKEFKRGRPMFSYLLLKTMDLPAFNAGSAVPTLNRNHVHAHTVPLPPSELIARFESTVEPLFRKAHRNDAQISSLQKLRDTLLPKLMSGEVRVVV